MKKILVFLLALAMLLSLVACGEATEEPGSSTSQQQEESSSITEGDSDSDYQFDIEEDDNTVIITIGNTIQVYTHDGVNVTGYTTYVDSGDADTAKAVASAIDINDSYYEGMGLKSVTTKGKYVVQEYNEEGFPCTTYEELHDLAEQYKMIQQ